MLADICLQKEGYQTSSSLFLPNSKHILLLCFCPDLLISFAISNLPKMFELSVDTIYQFLADFLRIL